MTTETAELTTKILFLCVQSLDLTKKLFYSTFLRFIFVHYERLMYTKPSTRGLYIRAIIIFITFLSEARC